MSIGEKIRAARKKAGLTQDELAQCVGVKRAAVSKWEKEARNVKIGTIKELADALDVPFESLISDTDEERSNPMSNDFAIHVMKEAAKVAENPESQAAFEAEMQHRSEHARMIDERCDQAMEAMNVCLDTIRKVLVEYDTTIEQIIEMTEQAAKLGNAMANLRTCMNYPAWAAVGHAT